MLTTNCFSKIKSRLRIAFLWKTIPKLWLARDANPKNLFQKMEK